MVDRRSIPSSSSWHMKAFVLSIAAVLVSSYLIAVSDAQSPTEVPTVAPYVSEKPSRPPSHSPTAKPSGPTTSPTVRPTNPPPFSAQAWQDNGFGKYTFPEEKYPYVASRPNVGVTFSGGGDRAYTAAIGALGGFHEVGLIPYFKYLAGSSGGSWAVTVYSFYQHEFVNDTEMLGSILFPADITLDKLNHSSPYCVRNYPNTTYKSPPIIFADWADAVQYIYLRPSGINRSIPFTYNNASLKNILLRNPSLSPTTPFYLLRGNNPVPDPNTVNAIDKRPFPIIQATLDGPSLGMPWDPSNRNYTMLEWTPLTAGITYTRKVVFNGVNSSHPYHSVETMGGYVDPYAFGGNFAPQSGLPSGSTTGFVDVLIEAVACDVAMPTSMSSWAIGNFLAGTPGTLEAAAGIVNYWSPVPKNPSTTKFAVADGAGVSNTDLISFLVRNVTTIIAFVNTGSPLMNSTHWDPTIDTNITNQIDFTVPAWFGIIQQNMSVLNQLSYDLQKSQVFETSEFIPLAVALQKAQAEGNGVIVNMTHTTVDNFQYGVVGGRKVNVIWFYLGSRVTNWENELPAEMKPLVIPKNDPDNQANFIKDGPFRNFPAFPTTLASETISQVNLLCNLVGWVVYKNQNMFRVAVGLPPINTPSSPSMSPTASPKADDVVYGDDDSPSSKSSLTFAASATGKAVIVTVCVVGGLIAIGLGYYCNRKRIAGRTSEPLMAKNEVKSDHYAGRSSETELSGSAHRSSNII